MEKLLRAKNLQEIFGVSRQTIWSWRKNGKFPEPIRRIGQTSFWAESQFGTNNNDNDNNVEPSQSANIKADGEVLYV